MNSWGVISLSVAYLLFLFGLAFFAERRKNKDKSLINNPVVFVLSMAIYCTAWTFYGNVDGVSDTGLMFLTIYLGPTLAMLLAWTVLRKVVRIAKVHGITNIADFVSARFGKSKTLGVLVTVICLLAGIPYLGLQIKAIAISFNTLSGNQISHYFLQDPSFYLSLALIVFTILFGSRKILPNERHEGMIFAVAADGVIKLLAFLLVGVFVTYIWHSGFGDIFNRYYSGETILKAFDFEKTVGYGNWIVHTFLAGVAFLLLPRQFQVMVIENQDERHLRQAVWMLPFYLFLMVLFVVPLGLVGFSLIGDKSADVNLILALPLYFSEQNVAACVYLGGFSAATAMIIVETIAVSTMVTNNLVLPFLLENSRFKEKFKFKVFNLSVWIRRWIIILIILVSYTYYKIVDAEFTLVSLGLIAFVAIAQLVPAVLGGIYLKSLNRNGVLAGLITGSIIWFMGLVLPSVLPSTFHWLKPFYSLFSVFEISGFDSISNVAFWSLFLNVFLAVLFSTFRNPSQVESKQAILFVDIFSYSDYSGRSVFWKGTAQINNLSALLYSFLGRKTADKILLNFARKNKIDLKAKTADPALVSFVENIISQYVGTSSASILVSSVSREEIVTMREVLEVLRRSQYVVEQNEELQDKTQQLQLLSEQLTLANNKLVEADAQKDDFVRTVTHEFRTPLTAIKALAEIVCDNEDIPDEQRRKFLETIIDETDRLSRMVNQVLEIEKYESGKQILKLKEINAFQLGEIVFSRLEPLARSKGIELQVNSSDFMFTGDQDKLIQMLINLVSNSVKFTSNQGIIVLNIENRAKSVNFEVLDNGMGIPSEKVQHIFEKFFQVDSTMEKGSGLGLPIVKKIVELHQGVIVVKSKEGEGTRVLVTLPATILDRNDKSFNS